jgi:hypothetical protein
METFRLIIAGGREFSDYALLQKKVDVMLSAKRFSHQIEIVSGKAKGADTLGEQYAKANGFTVKEFRQTGAKGNLRVMNAIRQWRSTPMLVSAFGMAGRKAPNI